MYIVTPTKDKVTLPERGYFCKGDQGKNVSIIASFLAINFVGYEYKTKVAIEDMLGEYYENNLIAWVKQFQSNNGLETDGCIGKITLSKLEEYGLNK